MALSLIDGLDTVDSGIRVKTNEAINAIPTGYAISNGILTITKFDTSSDQVTLPQQRDQVIDGGDYTQVNNITFDIDAVTWLINNTTYNKATTTSITLGNGDLTNPRFDAIVLTTSNTVIALSGTAAASPVLPTISATQLLLMSVYIPANATSGTSDATVTYWGGYTANSMAPTDPLNLYKENYISGRTPNPDGDNSVAIGISSNATNTGSIAIGADALSSHIDSIAIGVNSTTTNDNQVSIKAQDIRVESTGVILEFGNTIDLQGGGVTNYTNSYFYGNNSFAAVGFNNGYVRVYDDAVDIAPKLVNGNLNVTIGTATLVGGTVTVNTSAITGNDLIFLTVKTAGGTQGHLSYTQVNNTSFTINSTSGTDTSTVNWWIIGQAY